MLPRHSNSFLAAGLLIVCIAGPPSLGQGVPNVWIPPGVGNYATDGNWDATSVPALFPFEERAIIDNGGTAVLSVNTVPQAGGISVDNGTLQIDRGGTLTTGIGASADGTLVVGANGNLTMGGLVGAGASTLTLASSATLQGNTNLIGHHIDFTAASIALSGALNTTVTTSGYSHLKATGSAALSGPLELTFNGVTPTVGDFWDLVDASSISGEFSEITTNATLGDGLFLVPRILDGGANGRVARVSVDAKLILNVDRQSGEISIQNRTASTPLSIDGYLIRSPSGSLAVGKWESFNSNGFSDFRESNPASIHLGELNLTGSRTIGGNASVGLGEIYAPNAPPLEVTTIEGDVSFEYHVPGGGTQTGIVEYVGPQVHNNLVLIANPDGSMYIQNQSEVDLEIDGYQIKSASGALNEAEWTSLASGDGTWRESNPSDNHLGELNLTNSRILLSRSEAVSLGSAFDLGGTQDLVFLYHRAGMDTLVGTVEYDDGVIEFEDAIPGDYDNNGAVEQADYNKWRGLFGSSDSDADGNNDGAVNAADYAVWRDNFGATGSGSGAFQNAAVPEPTTLALGLIGIAYIINHCRRKPLVNANNRR